MTVDPTDWATFLQNYLDDTYYHATFTWNGISEDIGIRQHGGGSRSPIKPNIDLNFAHYTKSQTFMGEGFLVLVAGNEDPSNLHSWLAMELFRKMGIPAPRESFGVVTVNGTLLGFYTIVEHDDTAFVQRNYGESGGYLYEWENIGDDYDFGNLGTNPQLYAPYLDLKTNQSSPDLQ
ncbi:MAG: CotH kinase family protein, partial [Bryobacteraceae bacterium]